MNNTTTEFREKMAIEQIVLTFELQYLIQAFVIKK